jgi:hypothetical protein
MPNGALTAQIAHSLQKGFEKFDILHDHRHKDVELPGKLGKLRSWFGTEFTSESLLADVDIAVVSKNDKKIYALIEIEETTDKPKVILGDILAILLGSGIAFQGTHDLRVGEWTTLIVMGYDAHNLHNDRLAFLTKQANDLKAKLHTPNASIGQIILDSFSDKMELENKLGQHVSEAIAASKALIG